MTAPDSPAVAELREWALMAHAELYAVAEAARALLGVWDRQALVVREHGCVIQLRTLLDRLPAAPAPSSTPDPTPGGSPVTTAAAADPPRSPVTEARDPRLLDAIDAAQQAAARGVLDSQLPDEPIGAVRRRLAEAVYDAVVQLAPRPERRVWLEGDTVPAGVWVLSADGYVTRSGRPRVLAADARGYVEVHVPDFAAAVATERDRRAPDPELSVYQGPQTVPTFPVHQTNPARPSADA